MNEMTIEKDPKQPHKQVASCCNAPVKWNKHERAYVCIICGKADSGKADR